TAGLVPPRPPHPLVRNGQQSGRCAARAPGRMVQMRLSKYHGLGNDFLVLVDLDGRHAGVVDGALAVRLCDRHRGVGADGLIRVSRGEGADVVMELWNADGSRAEMSGNGIRCLA